MGFEPTRPKPAELKSAPLDHSGKVRVPPAGLEPATFRLEVECAIQLRQPGYRTGIHLKHCFERLFIHFVIQLIYCKSKQHLTIRIQ